MPAILFGSISTLVDTSELQREAFNDAFAEHGLDWTWAQADYQDLLASSGGADRIAAYAADRGEEVDAAAVHATKSAKFVERLAGTDLPARPGVLETVRAARERGVQVGVVTTTSPDNVSAVLGALDLGREDLDVVLDVGDVSASKPAGEVYAVALQRLGVPATEAIAIEDNLGGVAAAAAADVACVAFPNTNTAGHDFEGAVAVVDHIDPDVLLGHIGIRG